MLLLSVIVSKTSLTQQRNRLVASAAATSETKLYVTQLNDFSILLCGFW